ncbi:hypothetical protein C8Q76DRAFT_622947 [Earliella scabrosa]|nr:hypothetical protein C8Q76DRAFT_622947 [Earliella scabrosa]
MFPKCLICTSQLSQHRSTDEWPTALRCGHVMCYGCFKRLTEAEQPFCPFRCDTTHKLRLQDGHILEFSLKARNTVADKRAAIMKTKAELHRASTRLKGQWRETKNDITTLTILTRNQKNTITTRLKHITRDAARAEYLRAEIASKERDLYNAYKMPVTNVTVSEMGITYQEYILC